MKAFAIILCTLLLALVACSTPTQVPSDAVPEAPSTPETTSGGLPTDRAPTENELQEMFFTDCDDVADPLVLADALPSSFEGLGLVGDVIAERTDYPDMTGTIRPQSNAGKTLTANDEYYVALSVADMCGLNTFKASINGMVEGESPYGMTRAVNFNGYPGFITTAPGDVRYFVDVLVGDRVSVHIDADVLFGEANTEALAREIDYASIERAIPS